MILFPCKLPLVSMTVVWSCLISATLIVYIHCHVTYGDYFLLKPITGKVGTGYWLLLFFLRMSDPIISIVIHMVMIHSIL